MMKKLWLGLSVLLITLLCIEQAFAWSRAGRWGGSASGGGGSWNATGRDGGTASGGDGSWSGKSAWGGSASGGDGSWNATGRDGGTASGGDGSWSAKGADGGSASGNDGYWHATNSYGTTAYGDTYHNNYYGGAYPAYYHPPTVVNSYSTGCYNCGGWAVAGAAATGMMVGAAAANANNDNAIIADNNINSYNAGYIAGSSTSAPITYPMNAMFSTLPSNCNPATVNNVSYFTCGNSWLQPNSGANGFYYRVVPAP
jgi:hypothetical protein